MGLFQRALILYVLFLLPVLFLWFPLKNLKFLGNRQQFFKSRVITVSFILLLIIGGFIIGIQFNIEGLEAVKAFFSGEWLKYIAEYRAGLIEISSSYARANYGIMLDVSSPISLVKSVLLIYINYLFAPFPWQATNWLDIYAFAESLLRFVLIVFSIMSWYQADGVQRRIWGLFLVIYFSMTFLWAIGTVNYGTSIRHHVLTNWIIIILGGLGLIDFVVRQFRKIFPALKL
jgi:hypothetical protein